MVFVRIVLDLLAQNRENSSPIHRELIDCCRWNKRAHRKKEVYHQVPYLVWLGDCGCEKPISRLVSSGAVN
jgi:hypothetical protein